MTRLRSFSDDRLRGAAASNNHVCPSAVSARPPGRWPAGNVVDVLHQGTRQRTHNFRTARQDAHAHVDRAVQLRRLVLCARHGKRGRDKLVATLNSRCYSLNLSANRGGHFQRWPA